MIRFSDFRDVTGSDRPRRRDPNTSPTIQSAERRGVCTKGGGRSQRELMTRAY